LRVAPFALSRKFRNVQQGQGAASTHPTAYLPHRTTGHPISFGERLASVKNAYWILLYAAKKLLLWLSVITRIGHAVFTAASKIRDYNQI
jgi:hypothetical protein